MIRRIINITFMISALLWAGCSDEGKNFPYEPGISIVSGNLEFTAIGGVQEITVKSLGGITATSSQPEWCRATVAGDKVTVEVDTNNGLESRTARITLSDGTEDIEAIVLQEGFYIQYESSERDIFIAKAGGSTARAFRSPLPITIAVPEEAQSWLTVEQAEGNLVFTAASLAEAPRGAVVKVTAGRQTIEYPVMQYDLDDFLGTTLSTLILQQGKDVQEGEVLTSILPQSDGSYLIDLSALGMPIKVKASYDEANRHFRVYGGQKLGTIDMGLGVPVYLTTGVCDPTYMSWDKSISFDFVPTIVNGSQVVLTFADNGMTADWQSIGMMVFLTLKPDISSGNDILNSMILSDWSILPSAYIQNSPTARKSALRKGGIPRIALPATTDTQMKRTVVKGNRIPLAAALASPSPTTK